MQAKIFVNLPVADLTKAKVFYEAIGFINNPQFTDHTAAGMMYSDTILVMLLTHDKFRSFTPKTITDTSIACEVLNALQIDDKDDINQIVERALAAGGRELIPARDHGFMYERGFDDLDGHYWNLFWMDPNSF
ncbi:MAG: hypothetical protein AAFQ37_08555 [Bacteroidota bacterium]